MSCRLLTAFKLVVIAPMRGESGRSNPLVIIEIASLCSQWSGAGFYFSRQFVGEGILRRMKLVACYVTGQHVNLAFHNPWSANL